MMPWLKEGFMGSSKRLVFSLLVMIILTLGLTMPAYMRLVEALGHRIPQPDIQLDYLKGVVWAVFLGLTIPLWPVRAQDKRAVLWVWVVKCFVMLGPMLFYESYYQTDAFAYFSSARHNILDWEAVNLTGPNFSIGLIIWLHQHSFFDAFHAAKISFGMIGFVAIYIFYRAFIIFWGKEELKLFCILAFFPSILCWTSVLGKDPLVLFGIAVYCYGVIQTLRRGSWASMGILWAGILCAFAVRPWLGPILGLPALLVSGWTFVHRPTLIRIVVIGGIIAIIIISGQAVFKQFGVRAGVDVVRVVNSRHDGFSRGGSVVDHEKKVDPALTQAPVTMGGPSVPAAPSKKFNRNQDLLFFIPQGMFTALFRPLPGEVRNPFGVLAGLEGAFLLAMFFVAIVRTRWKDVADPVVVWAVMFIVTWAAAYAFISYNLGTVSRYRLQILPLFLALLMYLARKRPGAGSSRGVHG